MSSPCCRTAAIVRDVLLGENGVARGLPQGTLIIDMSSSAPTDTRSLAADLAAKGIPLLDAPVSGGVKRAVDGSLAIMAGGRRRRRSSALARCWKPWARSIFATGPTGSGHAMKALNNYVSAAGLVAAWEALMVGRNSASLLTCIIDVLNVSTGSNNSTEMKMKPLVRPESFDSGFSLALMAKDLRIAADLAEQLGVAAEGADNAAALWADALAAQGKGADHSEIYRFLAARSRQAS